MKGHSVPFQDFTSSSMLYKKLNYAKLKKIISHFVAYFCNNPYLCIKLDGSSDIWEFRTKYNGMEYRLLAFWDEQEKRLVVATHGFVKKTWKVPSKEIARAEALREKYYESKDE